MAMKALSSMGLIASICSSRAVSPSGASTKRSSQSAASMEAMMFKAKMFLGRHDGGSRRGEIYSVRCVDGITRKSSNPMFLPVGFAQSASAASPPWILGLMPHGFSGPIGMFASMAQTTTLRSLLPVAT